MARIHPARPDSETTESERRVFAHLERDLPDDWLVLHARRFLLPATPKRGPKEGEVDFLVLDPSQGFLGLEVKGKGVGRDADGWYRERPDGSRERTKDPGEQAQNAVHAIHRYLAEHPRFPSPGPRLAYGWGVVFPFADVKGPLGPELPREVVIDRADLKGVRAALDRVFGAQRVDGPPVASAVQKTFLELLAPTVRLVPSLAARIEDESQRLVRLTSEQIGILDAMGRINRLAIEGAAGTGKTLVAMERARRLAADGRRALLLCFNRPLAGFLAEQADGFEVVNFHRLCQNQAEAAGIPFEVPTEPGAQRDFWEEEAPGTLLTALDRRPDERWDAVIVDEGQDFREYWWLAVERLLRKPEDDVLWVFHDPNQDIYGGGPTDALSLVPASLSWNCRNTASIAEYAADQIGVDVTLKPDAPEGSEVSEVVCADEGEMVDAVRKSLHQIVGAGKLPSNRVVVLSAQSIGRSAVWKAHQLGNITLVEYPEEPAANQVAFTSLHRFKGLESDAVIVCEITPGSRSSSPKHVYVACSRARHVLSVARYAATDG